MSNDKPYFSILDTAVIILIAVVFGSGLWRLMHDDTAGIARNAIAALRDDSRAATFRPTDLPQYWRAWPGVEAAHAEE